MNDLYSNEFPQLVNFFLPSFKLIEKRRDGATITKLHDSPKTPFDRLCESDTLSKAKNRHLRRLRDSLNPFDLHAQIKLKIRQIIDLATPS
jgi:hypothetical protein